MALLELANVETAYGPMTVLRGISLQVLEGQVVVLLGANGAGKTTLLRSISGLIPDQPEKGTVRFAGRTITRWEPEAIARLGLAHVLDRRGVFPELTVEENLRLGAYGRRPGPALRADLEWLQGLFPVLAERRKQQAGLLSGGEQQMLVIARALLGRPRLLMLDEPSIGLAPRVAEQIFDAFRQIQAQGTGLLVVEQNAHLALRVADYGYVLETGRVVLEGTAEALAANPNVQALYLGGMEEPSVKGYRRYRPRRRWA